jgi:hypothetical protein
MVTHARHVGFIAFPLQSAALRSGKRCARGIGPIVRRNKMRRVPDTKLSTAL